MTEFSVDIKTSTEEEAITKLRERFPDAINIKAHKRDWRGNYVLFTVSSDSKSAKKYS